MMKCLVHRRPKDTTHHAEGNHQLTPPVFQLGTYICYVFDVNNRETEHFYCRGCKIQYHDKHIFGILSPLQLIQYQEQGAVAFQLLVKSQLLDEPLNLDELMRYSITPVPHCLGTPDGTICLGH